ncbi:MAG TPA: tRNA preQ1(34) S-adenosylmethionine ribosyltransferase-isomerase QueA [Candidatus Methylacidiphilales bacterium]|jgi:S-adenosylmethionine:tRNA ribosyltransferase-isomerase|nr:tRNA preQ1(34) S-adenosylmethionine ribosyltransferase-isomerase QueA [Candidatus Methylacidiphilales bacterium]
MPRSFQDRRQPGARASDYEYELPPELIATHPAPRREESRLLVYHRADGRVEHRHFYDLPEYLGPDDLLVLNDSKVLPAALSTRDGRLEVLFLEETSPQHWVALVKPGTRARPGTRLLFGAGEKPVEAEVLKTLPGGERVLRFFAPLDLDAMGEMPLPPYIRKRRGALGESGHTPEDFQRYQTVYARHAGSVAAPTAGLHFTPELLAQFRHAFVTLHVGLGTFRPVKTEFLADHEMHEEAYSIPDGFEAAFESARRVIAVGTTSARVLEAAPHLRAHRGRTRIFIHPPYEFKRVDALLTNFHLPHSTLLMLVSALVGREKLLEIYREAVGLKYRFFSYGDAMLIV